MANDDIIGLGAEAGLQNATTAAAESLKRLQGINTATAESTKAESAQTAAVQGDVDLPLFFMAMTAFGGETAEKVRDNTVDFIVDTPVDIGKGVLSGADSLIELGWRGVRAMMLPETRRMFGLVDDNSIYRTEDDGAFSLKPLGAEQRHKLGMADDTISGFVQGISQFMFGFGPARKALGAAATTAEGFKKSMAAGAIGDFVGFTARDGNLSDMFAEYGILPEYLEFMRATTKDNEALGRFMNVLEGAGLGAVAEGLFVGGKKALKKGLEAHRFQKSVNKSTDEKGDIDVEKMGADLAGADSVDTPAKFQTIPGRGANSDAVLTDGNKQVFGKVSPNIVKDVGEFNGDVYISKEAVESADAAFGDLTAKTLPAIIRKAIASPASVVKVDDNSYIFRRTWVMGEWVNVHVRRDVSENAPLGSQSDFIVSKIEVDNIGGGKAGGEVIFSNNKVAGIVADNKRIQAVRLLSRTAKKINEAVEQLQENIKGFDEEGKNKSVAGAQLKRLLQRQTNIKYLQSQLLAKDAESFPILTDSEVAMIREEMKPEVQTITARREAEKKAGLIKKAKDTIKKVKGDATDKEVAKLADDLLSDSTDMESFLKKNFPDADADAPLQSADEAQGVAQVEAMLSDIRAASDEGIEGWQTSAVEGIMAHLKHLYSVGRSPDVEAFVKVIEKKLPKDYRGFKDIKAGQQKFMKDGFSVETASRISKGFDEAPEQMAAINVMFDASLRAWQDISARVAKADADGTINQALIDEFRTANSQVEAIYVLQRSAAGNIGRALVALKMAQKSNKRFVDQAKLGNKEKLEQNGTLSTDELIDLARQIDDTKDPALIKQRMDNEKWWQRGLHYATEFYIQSLLWGPRTHIINITDNAAHIITRGVDLSLASFSDSVGLKDTVAYYNGVMRGVPAAAKEALASLKRGYSAGRFAGESGAVGKLDSQSKIPGIAGKIINTPGNFLAGMDDFFRGIAVSGDLHLQQRRLYDKYLNKDIDWTSAEGRYLKEYLDNPFTDKSDEAVFDYIGQHPPEDHIFDAARFGELMTYTNPTQKGVQGYFIGNLLEAKEQLPFLSWFFPFVRTGVNITARFVERSPIPFMPRLVKRYRDDIAAGGSRAAEAKARVWSAQLLMGTMAVALGEDVLTGGGGKQRWTKEEAGYPPYSIKIGNEWVSYIDKGPFGFYLAAWADGRDIINYAAVNEEVYGDEISKTEIMGSLALGWSEFMRNKPFVNTAFDFVGIVNDIREPDRAHNSEKFTQKFATGFIPNIFNQAGKIAKDEYQKTETKEQNYLETLKSKALSKAGGSLWAADNLAGRVDIFGDDVIGDGGVRFLFGVSRDRIDKKEMAIANEFERLDYAPRSSFVWNKTVVSDRFGVVDYSIKMNAEQKNAIRKMRKDFDVKGRVADLLKTDYYKRLSREDKKQEIGNIFSSATQQAKKELQPEYEAYIMEQIRKQEVYR